MSRAEFDKRLGALAIRKAEKLELEKRKFQDFHISFKAERRRLIGELEEQLKEYVSSMAKTARIHDIRM